MSAIFRHRDPPFPHDGELYILDVDERRPDLGLHFGCRNSDAHVVVQLREPAVDQLIKALIAWKARHAEANEVERSLDAEPESGDEADG